MNIHTKFGLSAGALKILAMALMLLDHMGLALFPEPGWMRVLGRLAFPIFAFLIAQGYQHTRDFRRYCRRLLAFGLISEIPFDLLASGRLFSLSGQNVMFTLLLGLIAIHSWEKRRHPLLFLTLAAAIIGRTDYSIFGVLMVLQFHVFRNRPLGQLISMTLINGVCYGGVQTFAIAALIPILLYNGRKGGGPRLQALGYWFYPAHMLLLSLL